MIQLNDAAMHVQTRWRQYQCQKTYRAAMDLKGPTRGWGHNLHGRRAGEELLRRRVLEDHLLEFTGVDGLLVDQAVHEHLHQLFIGGERLVAMIIGLLDQLLRLRVYLDGEDAIVESMKRFANDAKCVEYLQGFKTATEGKMASYKGAMVAQMKDELNEAAMRQLQAVSNFENNMGSAMQDLVVREAAKSFRETFPGNTDMQAKAFASALKSLGGAQLGKGEDPVA